MSGSTWGGIVGGVIGAFFGQPQIGFMIGSMVGGYIDPDKIEGPRLTDATRQTANAGVPITFGYGTFPTTGNIIWVQPGPPTEHKNKERTGKGGPVQITYTYTRSYAIGICEGEIAGILMIKRNGKVVYDARTDAAIEQNIEPTWTGSFYGSIAAYISQIRGASASFLSKCTIYTGSETQAADPTIEAWEGVGNVPGHRGLAYIVVHDDDVTELRGAVPQYEFVVAKAGTVGVGTVASEFAALSDGGDAFSLGSGAEWPGPYAASPSGAQRLAYHPSGVLIAYTGSLGGSYSLNRGATWSALPTTIKASCPAARIGGALWLADNTDTYNTTNGINWASAVIPGYVGSLSAIGGHRVFMVAGDNSGLVHTSEDLGATFTGAVGTGVLTPAAITAVSRSDNEVHTVVVGTANGEMAYWSSGAWSAIVSPFTAGITCIYYADGVYVAASEGGAIAYAIGSPIAWTLAGESDYTVRDLAYAGGLWVAACQPADGSANAVILTSTDPATWTLADESFVGNKVQSVVSIPCSGTPIPDAPGWYIEADGGLCGPSAAPIATDTVILGQIVADLFERVGIPSTMYDVSGLTDEVTGYRIASEGGVDSYVAPLMQAYFFDVGEWDGKLRCIKRGGASVLSLTTDDLAEKEGDAIEQTRVQEAELLRKVTIGYIDPVANYTTFTQEWERRSATIDAKGEGTVQVPVVMAGDDAAQVAEKRGKVAWSETDKFKFCLPYRRAKVTPTDVVTLYDFDGLPHRVRVMGVEEDSGVLHIEGARDRQASYTGTASGVAPTPITPPGAPLIGPTNLVVMNLPVWRSTDDKAGLYVAVRGYFSGWTGCQLQVSSDNGASYQAVAEMATQATIGYTTSALDAWANSETQEETSVNVYLPDAPESVSYETLLRYSNRAAVQLDSGEWAILQYQTVTALGDDEYTLSGVIHGRYNTTPGAAASGATFVLLDGAVGFVEVERWMIGQTLSVRAVSYGTDEDATDGEDFDFATCVSQTEWAPFFVEATRDGSDNVTTTWVGRGRIGTETAPYHSTYCTGYRVTYSDGETYDVANTVTTHTRSSAPASQTITVRALNSITGAGPVSESVTV